MGIQNACGKKDRGCGQLFLKVFCCSLTHSLGSKHIALWLIEEKDVAEVR